MQSYKKILDYHRFLPGETTEKSIDRMSTPKMTDKLTGVETSTCGSCRRSPQRLARALTYSFMASNIFSPTKMRIRPRPYLR